MKDELDAILTNLANYVVGEMTGHMKEKDGAEIVFNHIQNGGIPITRTQILELIESKIEDLINLGDYEDWGTYGEGFDACREAMLDNLGIKE